MISLIYQKTLRNGETSKKNNKNLQTYREVMIKAHKKIDRLALFAKAALSQGYKFEGNIFKYYGSFVYSLFYFLFTKMQKKQSKLFSLNPTKDVVIRVK